MSQAKIAIIGCGNLGLSIVGGLIEQDAIPNGNITATRRDIPKIQHLAAKDINVSNDNVKAVKDAKIIILTVKPYNIVKVCEEIKGVLTDDHILVSAATGISIAEISEVVGNNISVLRAMPNTAADVSESVTCICDNGVSKEDYQLVEMLFNSIGSSIRDRKSVV